MLEELITVLITAIEANTVALTGKPTATTSGKPETRAEKKVREKKEAKAGKSGKGAKSKITVAAIKAQAKDIALKTDDPKACMEQIRVLVSETADSCFDDASKGLDDFDETALILMKEELDKFKYDAAESDSDEDLSI